MKTMDKMVQHLKLAIICKHIRPMVAATVAGFVILSAGCAKNAPEQVSEPAPIAVRVAPISQQDLAVRVGYVGTVFSRREVKVLAQTAGAVLSLTPEGERVHDRQRLAGITAPEISARVSRMNAEVERAETERDFLCSTYVADRKLGEVGAVPTRQVDMSKKACAAATAAVTAAKAGAREINAAKAKTSEQAPFAGLVLRWLVEPGQNVMPGTPLLLLGSNDLELRVQVAERDLNRGIREGVPVLVQLGGKVRRLSVSAVSPLAVGPGRTAEVRIPLPKDLTETPFHGTSARVEFLTAESPNTLAIPEKALIKTNGVESVFIIDNGRARAMAVSPNIRDGGLIGVSGDIAAEAWVAVSALDQLRDGDSVFAVHLRNSGEVRP